LEKSLSLKGILLPFNAMRILVLYLINHTYVAGLTVGDPVLRTGNPLSVELGPGMLLKSY
jgi:hypothetical protein